VPEDRYGITGRVTQRKLRLAAKLNKRNRRLIALAGVPIMAIAGVAIPIALNHARAGQSGAPSLMLCSGWSRCSRHGYPSYDYADREYRSYWRMSPGDECTNYAAYVESTVYHVPEPRFLLGDGGQWAATAAAHGVRVNHTPSVGAVAEWDPGAFGMGPVGHVAVVEAVGPHDSYIYISQQHMGSVLDQYEWVKINANHPADEWQEWPSNFIHFRLPERADLGYFDAKSGNVHLRYSQTAGPANARAHLGSGRLIPLAGDWRGDGVDRLGYYNPRYGTFHLFGVSRHGNPDRTFKFGPAHMVPLVGDWTGHGSDGIGYYNPHTGRFYLRQKLSSGRALVKFKFGPPNMHPIAGDWNGGRKYGVGYYNPRTGLFALRNGLRAGPPFRKFRFGPPHMTPVVGAWTGGRTDGIGYYDRWNGTFVLRFALSAGRPNVVARFGYEGSTPLTGVWFGR
jgi:surface antigen